MWNSFLFEHTSKHENGIIRKGSACPTILLAATIVENFKQIVVYKQVSVRLPKIMNSHFLSVRVDDSPQPSFQSLWYVLGIALYIYHTCTWFLFHGTGVRYRVVLMGFSVLRSRDAQQYIVMTTMYCESIAIHYWQYNILVCQPIPLYCIGTTSNTNILYWLVFQYQYIVLVGLPIPIDCTIT